ncbi:MAG: hypothetical protein WD063_18200 [Pirellulales bacterium]
MAHPLERKIGQVRHRARRLLALYAAGWTIAAVGAAALVLGLADYLIRFQDHGIRLMCSLAVVAVFGWACRRFWYQGLGWTRLGDVQIAQRIERRFPGLADRLASSIQFLKQSEIDPQAGSAALRRAVIIQTGSEVERLDVSQVFQAGPTRRALALAGLVVLLAGAFAAASPTSARMALVRLARPLGDDAWPRFYRVEFRSTPTRLAAGQNFEVELARDAAHRVPDDVRIYYRYETDGSSEEVESEPMRWVNGAMVARKESVTRPFWYRAEGGDDSSMDWIRLEVLEAPKLESVQVTLHAPEYTGLPAEESAESIHALRGTRVELLATATKKLRRATLRHEAGAELPLELSADGYTVSLKADAPQALVIDKTGQYWIELEDREGLVGGVDDRWDIRAIGDLEPTVTIEQPGTNVFVTPQGEVSLKIAVKEDLAIHTIALHFSRSDVTDVEDFAVPLYSGEDQAPRLAKDGLLKSGKLGESRVVVHRWLLSELDLAPAVHLTFWATATDYLPQTGKSTVRKITIITPAELEERLAQRQTLVFAELQRVLKMQQAARTQTRSLEIQLNEVGRVSKPDVDQAQSAELNQRQVTRTLTSQTEGIPAQIADFLAELHSNRVDNPDVERHMTAILEEVDRLAEQHLGTIESELTSFIKAAQAKLPRDAKEAPDAGALSADKELKDSLAGAGRNQDQVISSLESMLGELGRWDNYRRFARDITQFQRDQEEISRETKDMRPSTLGRDYKELNAQQQADLAKLGNRQVDLSRRLEKTQQQMAEMSRSLAETDPIAAATVGDGLHQARGQAISGQMRKTGEQLEKNQLGQAVEQQVKIAKDLEDLLAILSNRREQELTRLVKQLRDAQDDLAKISSQQAGLRKKMKAAADETDPQERKRQLERLAREQKQLEQDAARLARRLERLQAEGASRSTSSAAGKMAGASDAGGQGDADHAGQNAEAAEKDLEEAQQQLAARRQQAEEDLAREQIARLEDSLKSLHQRQKKLIEETQRLENLRAVEGRLTRSQLGTVNDLARQQEGLRGESSRLAEKLAPTEVINLALDGAARHMARAAELLEHRETGTQAQGAQERARLRLAQLLSAFEDKQKPGQDEGGGGGGSGGGSGSRSDGNFVLAQLKLLRLLQEDLNTRYRSLISAGDEDAGAAGRQMAEMALEQGKLAELTLKLSEPSADNPEDNPEKLPDVRQDDAGPDDPPPDEPLPEAGGGDVPPPDVPIDPEEPF